MITISPQNIREIAQDLQCGLRCFYNSVTEEIKSHPDFMSDAFAEPEMWQEMLDEIAENSDQYIEFEKLPTRESFEMMETFVDRVKDKRLQNSLINELNRPKPFRNFRNRVDDSDYREAWFKFKDQFYEDWVRQQLDRFNLGLQLDED